MFGITRKRTFALNFCLFSGFTILLIYSLFWALLVMLKEVGKSSAIQDLMLHSPPKPNDSNVAKDTAFSSQEKLFENLPPAGYLVWSDKCRMQDVNPFTDDAMRAFQQKMFTFCSKEIPLTKAVFDTDLGTYRLVINEVAKRRLVVSDDDVSCCYQAVLRSGSGSRADMEYRLEECVSFDNGYVVPLYVDGVIIRCKSVKLETEVQRDAHFLVQEKPQIRRRFKTFEGIPNTTRPASVLLLGIDSMSRFNFRRTMANTAERLISNGWFELKGYNKIDDNTFPNLMSLLSGYKLTTVYNECRPEEPGGLEKCNMIWDLYRKYGYVTGYSEDETFMSTFNYYYLKGFEKVPVDHYQRPFTLAIEENLEIKRQSEMTFCLGLRHSAEYVYDFALDFATRYKGRPYFGLFWTNTFTHNGFSDASSMDHRIANYIDEMKNRSILDDSIVILFSDHGSRFGPLTYLKQGFLESRLPFIFIWLPPWFRERYPAFVEALQINRHRLTNPYDIHMTLKHILEVSGRTGKLAQAVDCTNCQSVLVPVPEQRSCEDIAIDDHWCTCMPYENVSPSSKVVVNGANAALKHLNMYLVNGNFSPPCKILELNQIDEAQVKIPISFKHNNESENESDVYRIQFTVKFNEEAKLVASLNFSRITRKYELISSVSRLDSYKRTSMCVEDLKAKMYCIC